MGTVRPVPPWITQVATPVRGEMLTDFWGPMTTWVNGFELEGYLVVSNYRFIFLRSYGPTVAYLAVQLSVPLPNIVQATAHYEGGEVYVGVNHLVFHGLAPANTHPGQVAEEIRSTIVNTRQQRIAELQRPAALPSGAPGPGVPLASAAAPGTVACRSCHSPIPAAATFCPLCGVPQRG